MLISVPRQGLSFIHTSASTQDLLARELVVEEEAQLLNLLLTRPWLLLPPAAMALWGKAEGELSQEERMPMKDILSRKSACFHRLHPFLSSSHPCCSAGGLVAPFKGLFSGGHKSPGIPHGLNFTHIPETEQ